MFADVMVPNNSGERASAGKDPLLAVDQVQKLVRRLQAGKMLPLEFGLPGNGQSSPEIACAALATAIRENLSTVGWRLILKAVRSHNRSSAGPAWDPAVDSDFLGAVTEALDEIELSHVDWKPWPIPSRWLRVEPVDRVATFIADSRPAPGALRALPRSIGRTGILDLPRALWKRLGARARFDRAQAEGELARSKAALYAARMRGSEAERWMTLEQVGRLRNQLSPQLQVFCQEQGIPVPAPYSQEEMYCLHLLAARYGSMTEAEEHISRHGAALTRRQILLEGTRAEVGIDGQMLPGLVEAVRQLNPLREEFLRERVRHKFSMAVGAIIAAILGTFLGILESITELTVTGLAHRAPVIAPALLIGLVTLAAQTVAGGVPLTIQRLLEYLLRAMWNGTITLGVTLVVYGSSQYFVSRGRKAGADAGEVKEVGTLGGDVGSEAGPE